MLTCAHATELLQARMDGELEVEEAIELGMHLHACSQCYELSKDFERLCALTVQLPQHEMEGSLARHTLDSVSPPAVARTTIGWRNSLAIGLAASIAVVCVAFALFSMSQTPSQSQPQPIISTETLTTVPPIATTTATPPVVVATATNPPFNGEELVEELCVQQFLTEYRRQQRLSKEEREREQQVAQLLRELRFQKKAGDAAVKLANMTDDEGGRILLGLAAAVTDPTVGVEVFNAITQRQPEQRLAPVYIAALEPARLKQKATNLLCAISGKKYGPYQEQWLAWWTGTKVKTEKEEGRLKL